MKKNNVEIIILKRLSCLLQRDLNTESARCRRETENCENTCKNAIKYIKNIFFRKKILKSFCHVLLSLSGNQALEKQTAKTQIQKKIILKALVNQIELYKNIIFFSKILKCTLWKHSPLSCSFVRCLSEGGVSWRRVRSHLWFFSGIFNRNLIFFIKRKTC